MAQQIINTGAAAGDKTGDSLRTAGNKINLNFSELYSVKVPTVAGASGKFLSTDGQNVYWAVPSVQNGVVTTGSYTDPSWILSLSYSKITGAPGAYSLPTSSTSILGGVKVDGSSITINGNGVISSVTSYSLPTASTSTLGGVKVDGSTITISSGTISSILPTATTAVKGGVKVDGSSITINNETISAPYTYTLPIATSGTLGGVKQGTNVSIDVGGVISVATGAGYTLPTATTSVLGGVIADGTTIAVSSGTISALASNIRTVAAAMFTGGTQTGLTFSYNSGTGLMTSTNTNGAGGSGITGVTVQQATVTQGVASAITTLNFTGAGVTASASGGVATVNIPSNSYTLPTATSSVLGGVKVDNTTITAASGVISAVARPQATTSTLGEVKVDGSSITINAGTGVISATAYTLPTAGVSAGGTLGGVKVDGSTISINGSGVISASLPTATLSVIGGVKPDGSSITINAGIISATAYSLPTASISTLGGVKIDGTTLSINGAGVLSSNYVTYTLPTASTGTLGGVKVDGSTITISSGVISAVVATPSITVSTLTPGTESLSYSAGTLSFTPYLLPTASISTLGGVKVDGSTITINNGTISAPQSSYTLVAATAQTLGGVYVKAVATSGFNNVGGDISLATASTTQLGGVKVDGSTITITNGVITAVGGGQSNYVLPTATTTVLGGVKVDGTTVIISNGVISSTSSYTLPTASTSLLGGVKVDGSSITINAGTGVISANISLPTASTTTLGGVKVDGSTITISNGTISATATNGLNGRVIVSTTTASLASGASATATVTAAKGYALYSIQSSAGAWVTVYSSSYAQTSDSGRSITTDPTPGSGVIAESISTSSAITTYFTPAVFGFNADPTPGTNMYLKIYNNSGSTAAITVSITYLKLEA
jgi:hypothetical protein